MGQSQQEANQAVLPKGNRGCHKCTTAQILSGLGTDNHSPSRERKDMYLGSRTTTPLRPPQADTGLAKHGLGFRHGTQLFLHTSGPQVETLAEAKTLSASLLSSYFFSVVPANIYTVQVCVQTRTHSCTNTHLHSCLNPRAFFTTLQAKLKIQGL